MRREKKNDMVSLGAVVPIYGSIEYAKECLDSISSQSKPFDRVVLVEDATSDPEMLQMLRFYVANMATWELLENESAAGIVESTNRGVRACQTDYVALIDCDDLLVKAAAERLKLHLEGLQKGFVSTRYATFSDSGSQSEDLCLPELKRVYPSELHLVMDHLYLSHLKVVQRQWFLQRGGFKEGTDGVQDWFLALDAVGESNFSLIDEVLYLHRIHPVQTTATNRSKFLRLVNTRRWEFLNERYFRSRLSAESASYVVNVAKALSSRSSESGGLPAFFLAKSEKGLHALPASVPIIDAFTAITPLEWLMVVGNSWIDIGQLCTSVGDRSFSLGICMQGGHSNQTDLVRWYSGYLDFLVVPDAAQHSALAESIPDGLPVFCFRGT